MTFPGTRDLALINAAGFLRSFGVGLMGVVFRIYLFRTGLSSLAIGLIIAVGLAGAALATVSLSLVADRVGHRSFLLILSLLSGMAGLALAVSPRLPVLVTLAFVGMLNGTCADRSAASALGQAIIPGLASDMKRTWNLAWYNVRNSRIVSRLCDCVPRRVSPGPDTDLGGLGLGLQLSRTCQIFL
jgi:MFS family permease